MTGILRAGLNLARDIMIPPPTAGWKTIWANQIFVGMLYSPSPGLTPLQAHGKDLLRKIFVATTCYAAKDLSLCTGFSKLLSHSIKASKIAQPVLDRIASVQGSRFLSIHMVILAPVILKLTHIFLIYVAPKKNNRVLKTLTIVADKSSKGLEFLWNLHFTLNHLVNSPTVGRSFIFVAGHRYYISSIYNKVYPIVSSRYQAWATRQTEDFELEAMEQGEREEWEGLLKKQNESCLTALSFSVLRGCEISLLWIERLVHCNTFFTNQAICGFQRAQFSWKTLLHRADQTHGRKEGLDRQQPL